MFGHLPELVIVMIIGLIVFGPEKLPEVAGNVGKVVREFKTAVSDVMNPQDARKPDDFSAYYYESMARSGESIPPAPGDTELTGVWPGVAGTEHVEMAMGQPEDEEMPSEFSDFSEHADLSEPDYFSFHQPDAAHDASLPHDEPTEAPPPRPA